MTCGCDGPGIMHPKLGELVPFGVGEVFTDNLATPSNWGVVRLPVGLYSLTFFDLNSGTDTGVVVRQGPRNQTAGLAAKEWASRKQAANGAGQYPVGPFTIRTGSDAVMFEVTGVGDEELAFVIPKPSTTYHDGPGGLLVAQRVDRI